eukprot:Nitzschia sp. Nitz4//scaffold103_size77763//29005//31524//NITZ4_005441-RA/size77763-processed-gene-0.21-mRNA-1//-1//CDS//3329532316//4692//frame0
MVQLTARRKMKERGRRHSSQRRKGSSYLAQFRRRSPSSERSSVSRFKKVKKSWSRSSDPQSISSSGSCSESTTSSAFSRERYDTRGRRRHHRPRRISPVRSQESFESDESSYSQSSTSTSESPDPVHSLDTLDNSESKLQDIGLVVRASDLSDYSDLFTLDSDEKEEFEDFVEKYDKGGDSHVQPALSQESAVYSLPHNESRDVNVALSREEGGCGNCMLQTFFCLDEESVQGSYGGLRNDEVLIAESFPTDSCNRDVDESLGEATNTMTALEEDPWSSEMKGESTSNETDEKHQEPEVIKEVDSPNNTRWNWSCFSSWAFQQSSEDQSDTLTVGVPEEEEDDKEETSRHSHTIVWQRSVESTRTDDDSLDDMRAADIVKKARTDNILSKFKTEDSHEPLGSTGAMASNTLCTTFVLGDNARVSGVAEIEAGDGDTAFVIFLEATRDGMTTRGQMAASQAESFQGDHVRRTARSLIQRDSEKSSTSDIVLVGDTTNRDSSKPPTLILEDSADSFLEQLGHLSEASYFCLDEKKQEAARVHFQAQLRDTQLRGSDILATTPSATCSISVTTGSQYMFCIRTEDLSPHDSNPTHFHVKREDLPFDEVAPPAPPHPQKGLKHRSEPHSPVSTTGADVSAPVEGNRLKGKSGIHRVRAGVHNYRRYLEIKRDTQYSRPDQASPKKSSRKHTNQVVACEAKMEQPSCKTEPLDFQTTRNEKQVEEAPGILPTHNTAIVPESKKHESIGQFRKVPSAALKPSVMTPVTPICQERDGPEDICPTNRARENKMSYEEIARLSRKLLLSDEPTTSASCMLKTTNVSFSSSSDEFFDAVSRTSSILSVD